MESFLERLTAAVRCPGAWPGPCWWTLGGRPGVGIFSYMLYSVLGSPSKAFLSPSAQSPPRGPGLSVSAGGKTCWSTTVARPGTTSTCPSVMTWATSSPCSATGRVTSAGAWTKTAEKCRAPARSQAPPLHVSTQGPSPQLLRGLAGGQLPAVGEGGEMGVTRSGESGH